MRIDSVQRVEHVRLSDIHTMIFAGGGNRCWWQASHRIPVSTWDCTSRTDVLGTFNFGIRDAQRMLTANCLSW